MIDTSGSVVVASESYWPLPWYYRGDRWDKVVFYGNRVDPETFSHHDPDIVIAVVAENGGYSSEVAVPIARQVIEAYYAQQ